MLGHKFMLCNVSSQLNDMDKASNTTQKDYEIVQAVAIDQKVIRDAY